MSLAEKGVDRGAGMKKKAQELKKSTSKESPADSQSVAGDESASTSEEDRLVAGFIENVVEMEREIQPLLEWARQFSSRVEQGGSGVRQMVQTCQVDGGSVFRGQELNRKLSL